MDNKTKNRKRKDVLMLESRWANSQSQQDFERQVGSSPEKKNEATQTVTLSELLIQNFNSEAATAEVQRNTAELKLYRPLLCPAEIKGKSVTDHQQDT